MRICHIFAAALLAATVISAGEAAAFSMQNSGSGSSAGGSAASGGSAGSGTNYLDTGDKLMQGMLGGGETGQASQLDQQGGVLGPKSGFSMKLQQTGPSDTAGANRYFSTDQNPWK